MSEIKSTFWEDRSKRMTAEQDKLAAELAAQVAASVVPPLVAVLPREPDEAIPDFHVSVEPTDE